MWAHALQHFNNLIKLDGLPLFKAGPEGTLALHVRQMALLWHGALTGEHDSGTALGPDQCAPRLHDSCNGFNLKICLGLKQTSNYYEQRKSSLQTFF